MIKTELTAIDNDKEWESVADGDLLQEVRKRLSTCAESLVALANVVGPAVRRGLDLSFVDQHLLDILRKIESRQIVPELAERFMHCRVFNRLKNLPIDDQKQLVQTGKVELVVRRGDTFDVRKVNVDALTARQSKVVFERGRIRTTNEMIALLEDQADEKPDPFDEAVVLVKIAAEIELTKQQRKKLDQLKDKCGGMGPLLKSLLLQKLG